jgi:Flp pilus assembly protein TadD
MGVYTDLLLEAAFQAHQTGRGDEAEAILRMVIGRCGKDAHAVYFLGHLAHLRGRLDDAAWLLTHALSIDPNHARAHNDMGETLRSLGRNEDALPHLQRAIALEPTLAHAYGNLAATLVALNRPQEALRWAQESLRRTTDKAVAHCDLGSLFGRLNRTREAIFQYDLALGLQPANPRARYFRGLMRLALGQMPDAEWSAALGPWRKPRVGLAWSGSVRHADDRNRSVPLALLAPLLHRPDIACHVIQPGISDADRRAMADFPGLADHGAALTDFAQTAALLGSMDLVITVDTAVAHLAGALNIPTWVMLAHAADWRWMRDRSDSPWYRSMRLFRQKRRGDWQAVIEQVGGNLDQWAVRRG